MTSAAATDAEEAAAQARAVYGERFVDKARRVQAQSPHGRRPGWAVRPVIVKSGDDCRQELLAAQLIRALADIFQESSLPLYLRPYEVLVTSNRTALIELVPDSLSVHTIKAKSAPGASLSDHFFAKFGRGTAACLAAQRAFAESMAGYSIACYLLQIKDRHNGNILLDDAGHLIHIDFGFMLSNSPGSVNFEAAPFKLTRELLEVMDSSSEGHPSEMFDYYKVLCIQGFLASRKHADRIILLVEMMAASGCPCFKAGARAVHNLRKRFHLNLTETQCVEVVLAMIADSLDAWRTRQYDYYQRVLNGIL
ncbi:phophatdylinositol 4-kinase [Coccomyxa subellipsoidea C-169]|uniref:1-phosphatidylinositol 4-kinase n=1 Tax=Coccomyxa subellipsoidea (strain C-169) TaxID=574566 RepID=I0YKL8_COCSC|nr:phophatdylinositol 4-kinase [Coccomyxa subellipsoidea C-169]EIE18937.1 phophatdylinositol 4-kinase [Coccomyxa subellipsoidea C-169]|eukprot:XP_005643481.1 phophatdylinositol 4-kinase [Coccomyxa subellipsoidea C-169]